jgi:hypothetical protein
MEPENDCERRDRELRFRSWDQHCDTFGQTVMGERHMQLRPYLHFCYKRTCWELGCPTRHRSQRVLAVSFERSLATGWGRWDWHCLGFLAAPFSCELDERCYWFPWLFFVLLSRALNTTRLKVLYGNIVSSVDIRPLANLLRLLNPSVYRSINARASPASGPHTLRSKKKKKKKNTHKMYSNS